jgi:hypothetical protein
MGISVIYAAPNKFQVSGNQTDSFHAGRRIKAQLGSSTHVYTTVSGSTVSGSITTVTVDESIFDTSLAAVWYGAASGLYGSLPEHLHDGTEGEGGTISGTGGGPAGALLQDGSTPLTGEWGFGSYTISGTGDIITTSGTVDIYGHMAVGNDADIDFPGFPTYEILLNIQEDFDANIIGAYGLQLYARGAADSGSALVRGISANAIHTGSGQFSTLRGVYGAAYTNTVGATGTNIQGIYGSAYLGESTTTVTNLIGGYFTAGAVFGMTNASGINVAAGQFKVLSGGTGDFSATNVYGVQVVQPGASYNGTLTNLYGLYIEDMSASSMAFTNEYNIYSAGATSQNYFEGDIYFDGTISGTGDIYCNDIFTSSGTVYIGAEQISSPSPGVLNFDSEVQFTGESTLEFTAVTGTVGTSEHADLLTVTSGSLAVDGDIYCGDIIPTTSGISNIGSNTSPFEQLYLEDQATGYAYSVTIVSGTLTAALV